MAIPLPAAQTADSHTPRSHFPFSESTEELPVLLRGAGHDGGRASVKGPPKERCPGYALPHTHPPCPTRIPRRWDPSALPLCWP